MVREHRNGKLEEIANTPTPCTGDSSCKICDRIPSDKWGTKYLWTASERALVYVFVYQYHGESKYVKTSSPALLVASKALGQAVAEFVASQASREEINQVFDPAFPGIKFKIRIKEKGRVAFEGLPAENAVMPPLPPSWPVLKDGYMPEGQEPDPIVVKKFIVALDRAIDRYLNIRPMRDDDQFKAGAGNDDNPKQRLVHGAAENDGGLINPMRGDASPIPDHCPTGFGAKPDKHLPVCLTCEVSEECEKETGHKRPMSS